MDTAIQRIPEKIEGYDLFVEETEILRLVDRGRWGYVLAQKALDQCLHGAPYEIRRAVDIARTVLLEGKNTPPLSSKISENLANVDERITEQTDSNVAIYEGLMRAVVDNGVSAAFYHREDL